MVPWEIPMIGLIFYLVFLSALGATIFFLIRQKGTYFRSVQLLFAAASILIALATSFDLIVEYLVKTEEIALYSEMGFITAAFLSGIMVEHAALMVYKGKQKKVSWKKLFSDKLNLLSISYKSYVVLALFLTIIFHPWEMQLARNIWGNPVYISIHHELWYLAFLLPIPLIFIAYPCMLFILSSRKYKEESVVTTLKLFAICWISIGSAISVAYGLRDQLGIALGELNFLLYTVCFGSMAYSFKKTNILESFFETLRPSVPFSGGESVLFTYTSKTDKMKMFSTLIWEGLIGGNRVIYKYPDNEDKAVRKNLKEHGVDVEKREKEGSLILTPLSQFYLSDGFFNGEKAIRFLNELKADSLKKGYTQLTDFVDLGDFSFLGGNGDKYIEYLKDKGWKTYVDEHVIELFAVNSEKINKKLLTQLQMHASLRSIHPVDLITHMDAFSKPLGLTHRQITGRHILLDFDPSSNYEKVVGDFATEALANTEQVALFTHKGSAVYSALDNKKALKVILLTQRISVPQVDAQMNAILLPANNASLLLDALDKTLKPLPHGNLNIIFDNLSSLILSIGLQKTYQFMRYTLDMLTSTNSTSLFLFNPDAHDQRVASSLRSLFSNHISYRKEGLQIVKLSEPKAEDT